MNYKELNRLNEIKTLLKRGLISYEEAVKIAAPILKSMNHKGEKIAKEFGQKYRPITFTGFMR